MQKQYLITGGAGFIGSNYASRLLQRNQKVIIFDNLSRRGADMNVAWLRETYGENSFEFIHGDVRNFEEVHLALGKADVIVHLAAQVAVTTSVTDPKTDFDINAHGTFNVVEAARLSERKPVLIYASTNKVYGGMEDKRIGESDEAYYYEDFPFGIPETTLLDFHSPYGCSKGAGDQYVRDYGRIYDLKTVVLRQSCIYGPRQFGIEDQGWLAWFVIAALTGKPITIYGDGKQVRDVLYVDDLLDAYDLCINSIDQCAGEIFNVGGGPENTISVWKQFGPLLEEILERKVPVSYADWRPGDQKVYVTDIRTINEKLGWKPKTDVQTGIKHMADWILQNKNLFVRDNS